MVKKKNDLLVCRIKVCSLPVYKFASKLYFCAKTVLKKTTNILSPCLCEQIDSL